MSPSGNPARIADAEAVDAPSPQAQGTIADPDTSTPAASNDNAAVPSPFPLPEAMMATLGFDIHGYSRFLQRRGIRTNEAETFAEATDQFVMAPLLKRALTAARMIDAQVATQEDTQEIKGEIQTSREACRGDIAEVDRKVESFHQEFSSYRQECAANFTAVRQEFSGEIAQLRLEIQVASQRAIITFGVMLATAVGILSATIGFFT